MESAAPAPRPSAPDSHRLRALSLVALVCSVIVMVCGTAGVAAPIAMVAGYDGSDGSGGMFDGIDVFMKVSVLTLLCLIVGSVAQLVAWALDVVVLVSVARIPAPPPPRGLTMLIALVTGTGVPPVWLAVVLTLVSMMILGSGPLHNAVLVALIVMMVIAPPIARIVQTASAGPWDAARARSMGATR